MSTPLKLISSMATRAILQPLSQAWSARSGTEVRCEAVGGVDAAKRVAAGEAVDVVVLAQDAIDKLIAGGSVRAGSRVDLTRSGVAAAVPAGASRPDLSSEATLKAAVLSASSVGYSTGPSGVALAKLFERWGIADQVAAKMVQAQPGVPVGSMIADGRIALGFQQLSELIHVPGIDIVGPLPEPVQIDTVFSAGVASASAQAQAAQNLIDFLASAEADATKRAEGMSPV